MKILIINRSDSTGGAAIVSRRLMEALRERGEDARMLVCEKTIASPYITMAASKSKIQRTFLKERLKIFIANGLSRKTLFKIDTGSNGLPLWRDPQVKEADAILINWVNQGMLSLKGVRKIFKLGKPVIWTMHDMWCMTGICHHAGTCNHFYKECGDCHLLGRRKSHDDLSFKVWKKKNKIFGKKSLMQKVAFVPVSKWLKDKALESSLLKNQKLEVIHNAFRSLPYEEKEKTGTKVRILFGAARLDDPIKGMETLKRASQILSEKYPTIAENMEIALFGDVKNPRSLEGFSIPTVILGILKGEKSIADVYSNADIVVSASSYETLPGTLVEAQAYGCIPVSFNRGGQNDIIDQLATGYIADYDRDPYIRATNLSQGIVWAYSILQDPLLRIQIRKRMKLSVEQKFSYETIAMKYLNLIKKLAAID